MEMDHDAGVDSNTFHRLVIDVDSTPGTPKEVGHQWAHDSLCAAHHALYMTQGCVLSR
jgi:hypothetical protein